jgi:putative ABC transport system permease protein
VAALIPFVIAFGIVGVIAARRPLLRRMAVRNVLRRRGQSLVVIAGLMVGTATITSALLGADSVGDSAVDSFAFQAWGSIDATVTAPSNAPFDPRVAQQLRVDRELSPLIDGVSAGIDLPGSAADLDTRQGASQVTLFGFDVASQGPFGNFVTTDGRHTSGDDLPDGEVFISRTLADKIDAVAGHRLRVSARAGQAAAQPTLTEVKIAAVVRSEGPGAYTLGSVVFAPLPTAQRLSGINAAINIVRISAPGGIRDSLPGARRAFPVLSRAVKRAGGPVPLIASNVKAKEADNATTFTSFIRAMLTGMSAIVIAAGCVLIVSLMGMLAEERRSQLGVLRALGLKRRRLVTLSVIEGAIYSLGAGVVGAVVGLGMGRIIAARFGTAFSEFAGQNFDFQFHFKLKPASLVSGFAIGSILTLIVVFISSWRTSRMTIVAAIRNLPEPPRHPRRWVRILRRSLMGAGGALALAGGAAGGTPGLILLGAILLILVASSIVRPRLSPRVHATVTGLALAGVSFGTISGMSPETDPGEFFGVFVIAMLTSVFGLTTLAAGNLHIAETVVGLLGRAFTGLRAVLRPPLAYLARRPTRTGLTTGVFAIIIGMLTMFAVFAVIFKPAYERFGGGNDVRVLSTGSPTIDLPEAIQASVSKATFFPTLGYVGPIKGDEFSNSERMFVPLFTVPGDAADNPPLPLESRSKKYKTDRNVWQAIVDDKPGDGKAKIVTNFGSADTTITLTGASGPVSYEVVGVQMFGLLDGLLASDAVLAPYRGNSAGAAMLIDLKPGANARQVARAIEADLFEKGVDADTVQSLLDQADRANKAFFSTIDILMRMGLVVGILALGIVALRIITERRHVIGVMRALGYQKRAVMGGLLTESVVTASIGAFVGIAVGLTMGYLFWRQEESAPPFGVDVPSLAGVLALVYIAVLIVTFGPAWRASKLPPAEAVRYTE